jgi:hypothetical protein
MAWVYYNSAINQRANTISHPITQAWLQPAAQVGVCRATFSRHLYVLLHRVGRAAHTGERPLLYGVPSAARTPSRLAARSNPSTADRLYWPKILFVLYIPLRFITVVIKTKPHDPAQQADKSTAHSRIIWRVRKIHVRPSAWKNSTPTERILMKALHLSFPSKTYRENSSLIKIWQE